MQFCVFAYNAVETFHGNQNALVFNRATCNVHADVIFIHVE